MSKKSAVSHKHQRHSKVFIRKDTGSVLANKITIDLKRGAYNELEWFKANRPDLVEEKEVWQPLPTNPHFLVCCVCGRAMPAFGKPRGKKKTLVEELPVPIPLFPEVASKHFAESAHNFTFSDVRKANNLP